MLASSAMLREACVAACKDVGLTVLGDHFYQFEGLDATQVGGATGAVVFAESHLAIHTWPERDGATLDVYVCNVTCDNSDKAEKLYETIVASLAARRRPRRARLARPRPARQEEAPRGGEVGFPARAAARGGPQRSGAHPGCPRKSSSASTTRAASGSTAPRRAAPDALPAPRGVRHAGARPHLPPRRLQHDLRARRVLLPREPRPSRRDGAPRPAPGARDRRRRRRLLRGAAQAFRRWSSCTWPSSTPT